MPKVDLTEEQVETIVEALNEAKKKESREIGGSNRSENYEGIREINGIIKELRKHLPDSE